MKKQWLIPILMLLAQAACMTLATPVAPTSPVDVCPTETVDLKLLMNTEDGYCLLYPAGYSTNPPGFIVINPISAPGDMLGEAWVSIDMETAADRTAAQVADAQVAAAGPGFNITRSDILVDEKQAVVIDGLPGPDPWRKVFIVSNEQLYTLTFLPWVPNAEQPTALEGLYETIMDTLHFLPPTKTLPTQP